MLKHIFISFILFFAFPLNHYGSDTIPPTGKLISPKHMTVIRGNEIRLSIDVEDEETGIKEVRFYAQYSRYSILSTENKYGKHKKLIGSASRAPYETIWNCDDIPDQDGFSLFIYCEIEDNAGNIGYDKGKRATVVIDRNQELSSVKFMCKEMTSSVEFDGILNEWKQQDSITFQNGDNTIVCYSGWDKDNLYIGMFVYDQYLYSEGLKTKEVWGAWENDAVEILLDISHDHNSILEKDDKKIIISTVGIHYFGYKDFAAHNSVKLNDLQQLKVKMSGTLNNNSDIDSGYVIEMAVPWEDLGIIPKENTSIGFDIINNDQESETGYTTIMTWAGNEINTSNNPSEWGNLVLVKEHSFLSFYLIAIFIVLFIVLFVLILKFRRINSKKKKHSIPKILLTRQEQFVKKAKEYLLENFSDETINRDKVAEFLNISNSYLSEIFKKNTKKTLPGYLNEIRIEQAKKLLTNTQKNVNEISFEVGFNSITHFYRVFKEFEKTTPSQFRKDYLKSNKL